MTVDYAKALKLAICCQESYHFVNGMDIVPELPRWWQDYRSVDKELRIGSRFSFNFISARFKDHAINNYISIIKEILSHSGN